jgi:hypothetical protein
MSQITGDPNWMEINSQFNFRAKRTSLPNKQKSNNVHLKIKKKKKNLLLETNH